MNCKAHRLLITVVNLLFGIVVAYADVPAATYIRGIVRDSITTQGLPYSSIVVHPSGATAVTDSYGIFELNVPHGTKSITATCQGYAPKTVSISSGVLNLYDIGLSPQSVELKELEVRKRKYSKKNNPAVDFVRKLRNARQLSDPTRSEYYSYDKYERISLGINNFDTAKHGAIIKHLPFLVEHVDTSEINGAPVLNMSLKENASTNMWQNGKERTLIRGTRSVGVDEVIDSENVGVMLAELLRETDIYEDNITLLRNTFVSPLSRLAPDFYRFYLVDSAAHVEGLNGKHITLAFYPRNKASFGFNGHVYVPANDTSMFIRKVEMSVPKDINLNYIKDLRISQTYDKAPNGSRLKRNDDLQMVLSILPHIPELYVSRKINYKNHSFEGDTLVADTLMSKLGKEYTQDGADKRDSVFWANERVNPEPPGESKAGLLMQRLKKKPLFYWSEKILGILFSGYVGTRKKDSKFDIGPVNTFVSRNSFEGMRLRFGGMTTANLNPHLFLRGYGAYGLGDKRWKYGAELEYSFNKKKYHPREFPIHSLRLTLRHDVDRLGAKYLYTNSDNFVLSFSRKSSVGTKYAYLRDTKLEYTLELDNNLSFIASAELARQESTPSLQFTTANSRYMSYFDELFFGLQVRYAPGEKFYQRKTSRSSANLAVPVITLSHKTAKRGLLGTAYTVNHTELAFSKLFQFPVVGNLYFIAKGGHIWGSAPFTELPIPNANLSYTIQLESFALMNRMEFINSSYVALHATWQLRGALFNLIPGIKKLGLREVFTFNGLYGHLSERNMPWKNTDLPMFPEGTSTSIMNKSKPYMEVSAGIDNILSILRVDYVWRLTYRDVPYDIDRHGVRIALHLTF